ncbi:MAG: cyclic nucleotide-binding domain-containing protein [Verrucomicrobiaceae bacterium]|nr:cyclic nucleotide-binding domain-containing protein [Verrucomicrobiaceae bacterium]
MPSEHFQPGQTIFKEGDKSNEAYYLVSGLVEISISTPGGAQSLAKLGPGEVFGEMGMIMDRPRTATATALEPTLVEIIHEQEFEAYFIQNPERLHAYLGTLFERIRKTDLLLRVATQNNPPPAPKPPEGKREPAYRVRLRSAGTGGKAVDTTITKLPFRIGRAYFDTAVSSLARNDLAIDDHAPYQLSRNHCEIDFEHGHFVLRDRGSKLGSFVNGEPVSVDSGRITGTLKPGDNEIVLGTHGSPHTFVLNIEELA